jgi:N-acetyl-gamma-glutamyl-phosphate/LysW-gamma-L-alpha-aminoadipyl-6-phosphate reductase
MKKPIHIAILGGAGYGAGELLRLLTQHPQCEVVAVTSGSQAGAKIADVHPHLRGFYESELVSALPIDKLVRAEHVVLFSAQPHGTSATALAAAMQEIQVQAGWDVMKRVRGIDLSGDLRLKDAALHAAHYPDVPELPELRAAAAYGLTELNRDAIRAAKVVANPGCLATAAILAAAPFIDADLRGPVAIDAKTGSSGSGRQLKETTHHPTRHADFRAYKPLAHQHEPEIRQAWGDAAGARIETSFVAQSMDAARGIFVSVHATLPDVVSAAALQEKYRAFYAGSPFVRVVDDSPALQNVVGSNFCDVSVTTRGRQVLAFAAIDNLVKGMAGAAIQNMNVMCGLPETTGLWQPSLRPV